MSIGINGVIQLEIPQIGFDTVAALLPAGRSFNGSSESIVVTPTVALADNIPWTIHLWVKKDSTNANVYLYGADYAADATRLYSEGATGLYIYNPASTGSDLGVPLPADVWVLVSIVCDGTNSNNLKLYYNAVYQAVSTMAVSTQNIMVLGNRGDGAGAFYKGYMGDFVVYPTLAQTLLEIQKFYLGTKWRYQ